MPRLGRACRSEPGPGETCRCGRGIYHGIANMWQSQPPVACAVVSAPRAHPPPSLPTQVSIPPAPRSWLVDSVRLPSGERARGSPTRGCWFRTGLRTVASIGRARRAARAALAPTARRPAHCCKKRRRWTEPMTGAAKSSRCQGFAYASAGLAVLRPCTLAAVLRSIAQPLRRSQGCKPWAWGECCGGWNAGGRAPSGHGTRATACAPVSG